MSIWRLPFALPLLAAVGWAQPQAPIEALKQAQQLMRANDLNAAYEIVRKTAAQGPASPILLAALGKIDYLRGEIPAAEMEFKKALQLDDKTGIAWLGLGRVLEAASFRKQAKICYQKAFHWLPDDPEIRRYYARTLEPEDQLKQLEALLDQGKEDDAGNLDDLKQAVKRLKWVAGRKLFSLTSPNQHTEVKLSYLMYDARRASGFSLPVSLNGGKTVHLLMDTGAGGILLNRKAAEAAGLPKIADLTFSGVGDEGDRIGYTAFANTIKIGGVELANCPIGVSEKKFLADEDGLIGTDVFSQFLVSIDFQKSVVKLDPLPGHKTGSADSIWEDREVAPEFKGFTPFFRANHFILLSTRVNDSRPVLFLVDTGASHTLIDPAFAHEFTKIRGEDLVKMKGLSGKVDNVKSADFVTLQFSSYRQPFHDVLAIPLAKTSLDSPQMTGVLGIPTLSQFRIQIDYRDGLINFDYAGQR
jgi:predicted aspartyl protease